MQRLAEDRDTGISAREGEGIEAWRQADYSPYEDSCKYMVSTSDRRELPDIHVRKGSVYFFV